MGEIDYDKLYKRAKSYGEKRGLGDESEDFAQECLIKAFEVGEINLEYVYLNHVGRERADKRILSAPQGQLSAFRTVSLDAPIDSEDSDSARLDSFVGDPRECVESEREFGGVLELARSILGSIRSKEAREWAMKIYSKFLQEHL